MWGGEKERHQASHQIISVEWVPHGAQWIKVRTRELSSAPGGDPFLAPMRALDHGRMMMMGGEYRASIAKLSQDLVVPHSKWIQCMSVCFLWHGPLPSRCLTRVCNGYLRLSLSLEAKSHGSRAASSSAAVGNARVVVVTPGVETVSSWWWSFVALHGRCYTHSTGARICISHGRCYLMARRSALWFYCIDIEFRKILCYIETRWKLRLTGESQLGKTFTEIWVLHPTVH